MKVKLVSLYAVAVVVCVSIATSARAITFNIRLGYGRVKPDGLLQEAEGHCSRSCLIQTLIEFPRGRRLADYW